MKYSHYFPHPKGPIRGNIIKLPPKALQSAGKFEDAIGRMVSKFSRYPTSHSGFREEVDVELSDGTRLRFDITLGSSFPTVFLSENGRYSSVNYRNPPTPCADHPHKRFRVVFGENSCTTFITYEEASDILQDVAEGHGVVFTNNRTGRQTALPHHSIKRASLSEAPFGGHS